MNVVNLGEQNSVLNSFIAQMRDKSVQKDSMRFRRNLERVGEIFAYEISRKLRYSPMPTRITVIGVPHKASAAPCSKESSNPFNSLQVIYIL